VNKLLQ